MKSGQFIFILPVHGLQLKFMLLLPPHNLVYHILKLFILILQLLWQGVDCFVILRPVNSLGAANVGIASRVDAISFSDAPLAPFLGVEGFLGGENVKIGRLPGLPRISGDRLPKTSIKLGCVDFFVISEFSQLLTHGVIRHPRQLFNTNQYIYDPIIKKFKNRSDFIPILIQIHNCKYIYIAKLCILCIVTLSARSRGKKYKHTMPSIANT